MKNSQTGKDPRESEPFVKRIARFSALLYLGLAIVVVAVAAVGIFSISYDVPQQTAVSTPKFDFNLGGISLPPVNDIPVHRDESGVPAETSRPGDSSADSGAETSAPPESPKCKRPVAGEVIKGYSMDSLVFSDTLRDYRVHSGVDLAAEIGADVCAFADGKVVSVVNDYFNGTTVAIEHDHGAVSYYMNLDPALSPGVTVGSQLKCGDVFARVGSTARSESLDKPHLHFELRVNGALVDPSGELPEK